MTESNRKEIAYYVEKMTDEELRKVIAFIQAIYRRRYEGLQPGCTAKQ